MYLIESIISFSRYEFRDEDLVCKKCRSGTSCCGGSDWEDEGSDGNANMCSQVGNLTLIQIEVLIRETYFVLGIKP